jgi:hypothetical protein
VNTRRIIDRTLDFFGVISSFVNLKKDFFCCKMKGN